MRDPVQRPVLSCCICTHDGAERIEDALWSLVCQTADPSEYEILVIDNASQDAAKLADVVERVRARSPWIEIVSEERLGLSHAKNRAVAASRGDYVYFLDDDAVAHPRLVEHYLGAIAAHAPDVLGGNVLPLFEAQPPPELDQRYWPQWSLKHFGPADRWLADGEYFLGGNSAARRTLLEEHAFDPRLGRQGGVLMGGEEWHLGDARFRRRYVAGACIFHKVGPERQTFAYLMKRHCDGLPALQVGRRPTAAGAGRRLRVPGSLRLLGEELALLARKLWLAARLRWAVRSARRHG